MEILNYLIGAGIVIILISYFPKLTLFILGAGAVLFLVRLGADLYWWGNEKGKW